MYRIAIVRKNQPADRRTSADEAELHTVVRDLLRTEGRTITADDEITLARMGSDACRMADTDGFAALELGDVSLTVRPKIGTSDR
ncbi:hypothetical protein ACFXKF_36705 [Streptomyces scopuliridis]|uniref:hypothetical protein n=1 Tax=Streptomyces scopuliridis TaxID=452529 RepID=UPI003690F41E